MKYKLAMTRAIELAELGAGYVSPNPMVGAVIIKDGKIISEGYHQKYGEPHAEVNAIRNAGDIDLKASTIVVNLEPCSHHGKTPPCSDLIIEKKISKVIVGMRDPNPLVSGKGIEKLRNAGIEVIEDIKNKKCKWLNRYFVKHITSKTPYVVMKAAQSLDGKIATSTGESKWITCENSRTYTHKLRAELDAVLIGRKTVDEDDPSLNVRLTEGRDPKKIILDTNLSLKTDLKIFNENLDSQVILCCSDELDSSKKADEFREKGITVIPIILNDKKIDLNNLLHKLTERISISSLLVEGGSEIFSSFLSQDLVDELHLFIAPIIIGKGKGSFDKIEINQLSESYKFDIYSTEQVGKDFHLTMLRRNNEAI